MVEQSQRTSYIPLCSLLDDIEHHRVDFSYFFNLGSGEPNFVCMCTQPKYLYKLIKMLSLIKKINILDFDHSKHFSVHRIRPEQCLAEYSWH